MKLLTIVGTRPQFVNAAVLSKRLRSMQGLREVPVHTGQHYDANLSDLFFRELEIPQPDHHLGVGSVSAGRQIARMLTELERVLSEEKPDCVLVYGDTNSTLAGALAAATLHIPIAHVEAGLRAFNRRMPEEMNRVLTDHVSDLLFVPTKVAVENLQREGLEGKGVHLVGDVMYDAVLYYGESDAGAGALFERLGILEKPYVLVTVHRAENTDEPLRLSAIVAGLCEIAEDLPVVLPLHPRTRGALEQTGLLNAASRALKLIEPVGYLDMLLLERHARLIATDSGGIQKEAFFHRVPCVTLRDETEWSELVDLGWNRLAPPLAASGIAKVIRAALAEPEGQQPPADLYGGGDANRRIAEILTAGGSEGA